MRAYVIVTGLLFDLITTLQVVRLFIGWPVTVAGVAVPLWASGVFAVVAGSLAVWAFRLMMRTRTTAAPAP